MITTVLSRAGRVHCRILLSLNFSGLFLMTGLGFWVTKSEETFLSLDSVIVIVSLSGSFRNYAVRASVTWPCHVDLPTPMRDLRNIHFPPYISHRFQAGVTTRVPYAFISSVV